MAKIFRVIGVSIFAVLLTSCGAPQIGDRYVNFAKCLTQSSVKMYGAFWCPHCIRQKDMFGSAFQYVNYIECDPRGQNAQPNVCLSKKITGYPTWEFQNGSQIGGEVTFEQLAEKSGCRLPGVNGTSTVGTGS